MKRKKFHLTIIFCFLTVISAFANENFAAPIISKIEPPSWWANHTINPVRLLVRGENLQNAKVTSANKSLKISNIRINQRGDYLFFDVTIAPNTKPAKYEFEVLTAGGKTKIPFRILAPLNAKTNFQGITNEDVIYLIMTDRFADGDVSNNKEVNKNNPRGWHGGDFKGITQKIPYLKELGITAIWLTPWYDNPDEANRCDKPWCPYTNYHGYHAIDYYGVENHFGSLADLQEMIRECHKNGIKVIQDQVANHVGIQHPWAKNPPLENWFSPFAQNTFNNSVLLSPNSSQSERDNLLKGWFNELLPDNNHYEPEVAKYQIQNALWWIAMTGIDGIRQDTIQYMPRKFIADWSTAILKQYPKFYMVGEVFERDSAQTAFFQGGKIGWDNIDTKLPSVFDFKLWETSQEVFTGKKPMRALRDVLKYDGLYPNINNLTTLTNNHDTDRFMSLQGATKEGAKLHTAFMLATRGIPQLYYGEEVLMQGGHDPDNRQDFTKSEKSSRNPDEQETFEDVKNLIRLRKEFEALKYGKTIDLLYGDKFYVFARQFNEKTVIVGINYSDETEMLEFNESDLNLPKDNYLFVPDGVGKYVINISLAGNINGKFPLIFPAKSAVFYEVVTVKEYRKRYKN